MLPKRRRNPKTKQSPNPRAASLIWVTRAAKQPGLPVPSPAVLSRVLLRLVLWLCHHNLCQVCPHGASFQSTTKWCCVLSSFRCTQFGSLRYAQLGSQCETLGNPSSAKPSAPPSSSSTSQPSTSAQPSASLQWHAHPCGRSRPLEMRTMRTAGIDWPPKYWL